MIKFNQNAWLKPCIDMNTDEKSKKCEKDFVTLMNNPVFGKSVENRENIEILNIFLSQQKEEGII